MSKLIFEKVNNVRVANISGYLLFYEPDKLYNI